MMAPTIRYLTLWLTEACNLHCRYCYRPPVTAPQTMSREVIDRALTLAAGSGRPFHVQLSGGEPTLVPELIAYTAQRLRKLGGRATLGLQTNGTRLTSALVTLVQRYHLQVGLSVDGPPAVHDALRGGFAETLAGMQLLEQAQVPFRVTTVVSAANLATLDLLVLMLSGFRSCQGIGLDLLLTKGQALQHGVQPAAPEAWRQAIGALLRSLAFSNQRRQNPLRWREWDLVRRAGMARRQQGFCHAARGESLAVQPDGTVYPCGQTCGEPQWAAGTVWQLRPDRLKLLAERCRPRQADCQTCPLTACCPGDCPSRLFYNNPREAELVCILYQTIWQHDRRQAPWPSAVQIPDKKGDCCAAF
ncbi:MAG: radical SAM protein [Desulfobacca sp.]|uniref:radical SAM protein n=1 Tax=Desulfobacca sp. TaxID=2067990 RepID=UPI00404A9E68